jgi:hypothetical protein
MKDIVIHRYTNQCKSVQLSPGFADFLKGTLYLYQSSLQIPNMELLVDFSHHPISMFMDPMPKNMEKPYEEWIQKKDMSTEIMECFNQNSYKLKEMLRMLREKGPDASAERPYYLICHEAYEGFDNIISDTVISDLRSQQLSPGVLCTPRTVVEASGKSYMKSVLNFNKEITEDCEYMKSILNLTDTSYCVLHLRMGDQQSALDHLSIPPSLEEYIETNILPKWGKNVLVMSDSFYTKKYLSEKYNITCTEFIPIHMGSTTRFWKPENGTSNTDIGQTLIEFMLMSQSSQIYIYSVYSWLSGFSKVCSHIYDIPMTVIIS